MAKPPPSLAAASSGTQGRLDVLLADEGALVKARTLKSALAALLALVPDAGSGITVRQGSNGPVWSLATDTEVWSNFQPVRISATEITVSPGTLNDSTPRISGTLLTADPAPRLTVPATGLRIVYLVLTATLTVNAANYVTGFTITSLNVEAFSSAQTSTNTVRYFELFRWQDGKLLNRTRYTSFFVRAEDNNTATGTALWTVV